MLLGQGIVVQVSVHGEENGHEVNTVVQRLHREHLDQPSVHGREEGGGGEVR